MFSVPGWNVSANLATQVEKPKPQDPEKQGKKAKKRKQKQEEQVNEANVGELWDRVIEGKTPKAPGKTAPGKPEGAQAEEGAQEVRGKKRKRGTRGAGRGDSGSKEDEQVADITQAAVDVKIAAEVKPKPIEGESKRDKKKQKKEHRADQSSKPADATMPSAGIIDSLLPPEPKGLTPLQKSMRQKLAGARFRHLNETLYTKPSTDSLALFKEDPSMFEDYHRGFAMQTEGWPENPVDGYVNDVLTRGKVRDRNTPKDKKRNEKKPRYRDPTKPEPEEPTTAGGLKPLPRNLKGHCTVADLGCGTASLSYRLQPHLKSLNMHIDSYDLSKPSGPSHSLVTIADISALPCVDGSADVAVFCLALMGTNWLDFIDEAYRILRWRGELWVAEIKSRFGRVEKGKPRKGNPPINSIGSLRKGGPKPPKKKEDDEGEMNSDDEAELATRIDGVAAKEGTDVSSFVAVLRAHGFVLDAPPEKPSAAIDLGNKMFVKMQFVKAAQPSKGKNVKESVNGLKMGMKGKKFTAVEDDDPDDTENAKVLKPCLYKIR
ncbi:25S rRNA (adenine645-N1)-methyltransferase [Didymosphaeria variabile]|uniref:Ribosomal RNA-processing protein 8 n=1 Tax=Didymosphaeria variabile TaxID=1932322 RepID=A0A9W8XVE9_9PLEO|nr:25S rRNA (adenine645-N1)-methyltransferase [Didymosphaeria variabile]KAJ4360008.1 25S rRNA (adenine645-N1)-methyltransferase [Didymosphaeria variabile]